MKKITVLIDNGHYQGNGNSSPDGALWEWLWCRETAAMIVARCRELGIEAHLLTPEIHYVSLNERVRRANAWCSKVGAANVAVISVHNNASGSTKAWRDAKGWLCFIDPNAGAGSKRLADLLSEGAMARGLKGNRRQGPVVRKLLTVTHNTKCPAVLTENMFMDNREDCRYLLSDEGRNAIAEVHVEAISKYLER